jgi:hypothetical protein
MAGVYLSEAPIDPPPPPPVTRYMMLTTVLIHILIHTGKGGRGTGEPMSRLEGR